MNKNQVIANSILWAAAIVAAAIVHAPAVFTTVLLPALWLGSFVVAGTGRARATRGMRCGRRGRTL